MPDAEEKAPKPFHLFIANLAHGNTNRDLSAAMQEIGEVLDEELYKAGANGSKAKGSVAKATLTLKITFSAEASAGGGIFRVSPQIDVKLPKPAMDPDFAWTDKNHNFAFEPQKQQELFSIRDVSARETNE